jgi:hypothetical protein
MKLEEKTKKRSVPSKLNTVDILRIRKLQYLPYITKLLFIPIAGEGKSDGAFFGLEEEFLLKAILSLNVVYDWLWNSTQHPGKPRVPQVETPTRTVSHVPARRVATRFGSTA